VENETATETVPAGTVISEKPQVEVKIDRMAKARAARKAKKVATETKPAKKETPAGSVTFIFAFPIRKRTLVFSPAEIDRDNKGRVIGKTPSFSIEVTHGVLTTADSKAIGLMRGHPDYRANRKDDFLGTSISNSFYEADTKTLNLIHSLKEAGFNIERIWDIMNEADEAVKTGNLAAFVVEKE
jgi:hypothetical protein